LTTYTVLIACQNDKTGKSYKPGDVVTSKDFPAAVLTAWTAQTPPVVEVTHGSDAKRKR
jgi:hypothetical protein